MNETAKNDFDPLLFEDEKKQQRMSSKNKKPRRWPYIVGILGICIVFIAFTVLGAYIAFTVLGAYKVTSKANLQIDPFSIKTVASLKETMIQNNAMVNQGIANTPNISPEMKVYSSPDRWCNGDEIMCTTTTTAKPTETLQKIIAAIPHDKSKQYKIRLSVTPVQDVGIEIENIEKNEKTITD